MTSQYNKKLNGVLFNAGSSKKIISILEIIKDEVLIINDQNPEGLKDKISQIQDNVILLSSGKQFYPDHPSSEILNNYKIKKIDFKKSLFLSIFFIFFIFIFYILFFSKKDFIVSLIPKSWEENIGNASYESMINNKFYRIKESKLSITEKEEIIEDLEKISALPDVKYQYKLKFHESSYFGSNALAFPGGIILITDDLISELNKKELLAVLSHEVAHIEERHTLKNFVELGGLTAISSMIFGDLLFGEILADTAILPLILRSTRNLEKDADLKALHYLEEMGEQKVHLFSALEKLLDCSSQHTEEENCEQKNSLNWLSTHPSPNDRLGYLERLSE